MELTTYSDMEYRHPKLFMMSKIQNLNGTHNNTKYKEGEKNVVYDVKDTKFEWNSQPNKVFSRTKICCL